MVIIGVMGGTGASGVYALAQKILSSPSLNGQPTPSTLTNTPSTETVTVTVTNTGGSAGSGPGNNSTSTSTTNVNSSPPAGYILLAPLSAVSGKTYAYFNHPTGGSSILVSYNGAWKAFSAVCTHSGCTIDYASSELVCPCHNGSFSAVNGSVLGGPPPRPLPEYGIQIVNGNIYVSNAVIN